MYIVGENKYFSHYNRGIFKLIPKNLIPVVKPKILDTLYDRDGKEIGKIGGVLLNTSKIEEEFVEPFVRGVNKIKFHNIKYLVIEQLSSLDRDNIKTIQDKTNLKVLDGTQILIMYLPLVLKNIQTYLKEDFREKEVLIIGEGDKLTEELIYKLHKCVNFITLVGGDEGEIRGISQTIYKNTGLSIFYPKKIDKILTNYSIIVNLKDDSFIHLNKFRKRAIIFDFSISKNFSKSIKEPRDVVVIEDFMFYQEDLNIIKNPWVQKWLPSRFYEFFQTHIHMEPKSFLVDGHIYTIEELVSSKIRQKGEL